MCMCERVHCICVCVWCLLNVRLRKTAAYRLEHVHLLTQALKTGTVYKHESSSWHFIRISLSTSRSWTRIFFSRKRLNTNVLQSVLLYRVSCLKRCFNYKVFYALVTIWQDKRVIFQSLFLRRTYRKSLQRMLKMSIPFTKRSMYPF